MVNDGCVYVHTHTVLSVKRREGHNSEVGTMVNTLKKRDVKLMRGINSIFQLMFI